MKVHYGLDETVSIGRCVVTTGTFDGVHIGHQVILKRIGELARGIGGESVLMTFHPHPRKVLYPDTSGKTLKMINTQREKVTLLEATGIDHLVIMPFTLEFARTPGDVFIRDILVNKLRIRKSVVGFNHFFGFNKEGNYDQLVRMGKEHDFDVEEIPEQDIQNETVSSTRIRKAIEEGNIQRANAYLNHILMMMGELTTTLPPLRESGYNTFTIAAEEPEKLLPGPGIYAVRVRQGDRNLKAIALRSNLEEEDDTLQIIPVDDLYPIPGLDTTVYFHRQLMRGYDSQAGVAKALLATAIEDALELIY